ncbi:outer membrane lipoprotein carrier protein LolA [Photobacterium lutimaris]|uniref:Outer-membrane lipoprotein carrier protein n=1 Tax=Photobacterium lutimaris TaxID=388278 RepID=A0A2T3IXR5_9GAMM|nr:outer membrane lipoprotein chaperone LolA [Photobacterium lutimaris]PSU33324.1 outer membrane lipoprotein carrier protein LolA [Photobacterium lutimaris]TDR75085.1 outer membrane lipoprotein carrier protein [Photobacterium lutimaris]
MIKKVLLSMLVASPLLLAGQAMANPQQELSTRLGKVNAFSADFTQTVVSPEGSLLVEGTGDVSIKRPNLFRWNTETPDENILISDGKTLWYYSPFIEQVTAMWLNDATDQTPFVLLTRNSASDWANYNVSQTADTFTLTPKSGASSMGQFVVTVALSGEVRSFSVVEQDGQRSNFKLTKFQKKTPASSQFTFTPPQGVELDDQRN